MNRHGLSVALSCAALLLACEKKPDPPPPCQPIAAPGGLSGLPKDTVWGFADLHAHPATELAFGGRLIWGSADDKVPVNASELPRIAACPVETHEHDAKSPLARAAGSKVFSALAQAGGFAHGPVGKVSGATLVDSWPNARDIIHQQMNVASIRRAYEGGLRLVFASTTDDQLLAAILAGPNLVDGFRPRADADYESARLQLDLIVEMADANDTWMKVVHDPAEARDTILGGRLAIVLALEMNGLREEDVDKLVKDYGVSSVIPIHLIDNDIGGTAVLGDLFNASSAAHSELYFGEKGAHRYIDVAATPGFDRPLGWPLTLGTFSPIPVYIDYANVPFADYKAQCYEPLQACSGTGLKESPFIELGQKNRRGLYTKDECQEGWDCPKKTGEERIRHLMRSGLIVDVSHMSDASLVGTMSIDVDGRKDYPLVASHGDVAHLCDGVDPADCVDETRAPVPEREIDARRAREVVQRRGVLGFGTSMGKYDTKTLLAARGAPLFTLSPLTGPTSGCASTVGPDHTPTPGCESVLWLDRPLADPDSPLDTLRIRTLGGVPNEVLLSNGKDPFPAQPVARIEFRGPSPATRYQRHVQIVRLHCSTDACSADVPLDRRDDAIDPAPGEKACDPLVCTSGNACSTERFHLDDLESVTLQWLYLGCDISCQDEYGSSVAERQCQSTWDDDAAPLWTVHEADLSFSNLETGDVKITQLGPREGTPIARIGKERGSVALYRRDDRKTAGNGLRTTGHLLEVSARAAPDSKTLAGASPASTGANVCVAVRQGTGDVCPPAPPPPPGSSECPEGWTRLNHRGQWNPGVTLTTFVRFPGDEASVCGVDLAVLDWDRGDEQGFPFTIDEIRVEAMEDPVERWVRRYAAIAHSVAGDRLGALAFGTDFNGLNGTTDISEAPTPPDFLAASACGDQTAPLPLGPLRFRDPSGDLGGKVLMEERGLATYGLLADMLAIVGKTAGCGSEVHDSLMLSAEATLRAWEAIHPTAESKARGDLPLAKDHFACDPGGGTAP